MAAYKLSIVSPHGKAFDGDCESLVTTGREGDFGVLAHHAPMIAMLKPGITKITNAGQTNYFVTGEGVCEVAQDGVNLLVDTATKTAGHDEAKTELAKYLVTTGAK